MRIAVLYNPERSRHICTDILHLFTVDARDHSSLYTDNVTFIIRYSDIDEFAEVTGRLWSIMSYNSALHNFYGPPSVNNVKVKLG